MIFKVTISLLFLCHLACGKSTETILTDTKIAVDEDAKSTETILTDTKIAVGEDSKATESLDYAILNVVFQNQAQRCGASLVAPQYLLTSATCVFDPVERFPSNITVTFPNSKVTNTQLTITVHPSYNTETHEADIAIIKLAKPVALDGKTIALASLAGDTTADIYKDKILRGCGMGSTANSPTPPKKLQCTDLYGVAACIDGATGIICTRWPDRDNNFCNGDYGGPLYLNSLVSGSLTQQVVGIAQFSIDRRPNAPCLDGHTVVYAQVAAYKEFITKTLQDLPFVVPDADR